MKCSPKQKKALAKARRKWQGMSKRARKAAMPGGKRGKQ